MQNAARVGQADGRRQVFVHGRSIETRPESVKARQTFGHFEVDTMQSDKGRGDVLVTITERLSRQHIVRQVTGRNSQAVTPVLIRFFKGSKMPSQSLLIVGENLQNITKSSKN